MSSAVLDAGEMNVNKNYSEGSLDLNSQLLRAAGCVWYQGMNEKAGTDIRVINATGDGADIRLSSKYTLKF